MVKTIEQIFIKYHLFNIRDWDAFQCAMRLL